MHVIGLFIRMICFTNSGPKCQKTLKWLLSFIFSVSMLILLSALLLPRLIDVNDYKETISNVVKQKTGRSLDIQGEITLSVFPWIGVNVNGVSLSQPDELVNVGKPMLAVGSAQVRVKFVPLLSKQVEVDTIILDDPELHLITLKSGVGSFTGLMQNEIDPNQTEADDKIGSAGIVIVVQGIELKNGTAVWDNQQSGSHYKLDNFNLSTDNLLSSDFAKLNLSGIAYEELDAEGIEFKLNSKARIDQENLLIELRQISANLKQADQSFEFNSDGVIVDNIREFIAAKNLKWTSDIALEESNEIDMKGSVSNFTYNIASSELKLNDVIVESETDVRNANFSSNRINVNVDGQSLHSQEIILKSNDLVSTIANVNVVGLFDKPIITAAINSNKFNALSLINDSAKISGTELDYQPKDESALKSVSFNANFNADLDSVKLSNVNFVIDESTLTGNSEINEFSDPKIDFQFELDQINLDKYIPVDELNSSQSSSNNSDGVKSLVLPLGLFKDLHANGNFKAQELISGGLSLQDINVDIQSREGAVTVTPKASLYDGKLGGDIKFSQINDRAELRINNEIDLVSLSKFLTATDVTDQLSGVGSLVLDILVTEEHGIQKNEGTIKLLAKNGIIKGVDLKSILDSGYEQYKSFKKEESAEDDESQAKEVEPNEGNAKESDETKFAELIGTFNLKDSIISSSDFNMKAPLFRIGGRGDIDLVKQSLDYLLSVSIVNSTDGQGGEALEKLKGITLPIRLSGDITSPDFSLDMNALYKGLVRKEINDKKNQYIQEKLGIEGAGELSSKELLKQTLINKLLKKDRKNVGEQQNGNGVDGEIINNKEQTPESKLENEQSDQDPKENLEDQLKLQILEGLFNL